jgi:hypothetical protein
VRVPAQAEVQKAKDGLRNLLLKRNPSSEVLKMELELFDITAEIAPPILIHA